MKKKLAKMEYLKEGKLTFKGEFAARIYADEIIISEIFATDFWKELTEYQVFLLVGCLCYESRERTEFYQEYTSNETKQLKWKINAHDYLEKVKRFRAVDEITALIYPVYSGKSIFDSIKNTNLLEGDIIRFFRQILDRMNQIKDATNDIKLENKIGKCQFLINNALKGMDEI
jgi:superfamily II RNA helicase